MDQYEIDGTVEIENIPNEIIRDILIKSGHKITGDYVYGIKWVTDKYSHMFSNEYESYLHHKKGFPQFTYEMGKKYYYQDSDDISTKFNVFSNREKIHSAGIWSFRCSEAHLDINGSFHQDIPYYLSIPILIKYPINKVIPLNGDELKGKEMEVVDIDYSNILNFIRLN